MREIFTSGTVGGAPGNRCFYLELGLVNPLRSFATRLCGTLGEIVRLINDTHKEEDNYEH